jgi:Tol biopolymer transport system component
MKRVLPIAVLLSGCHIIFPYTPRQHEGGHVDARYVDGPTRDRSPGSLDSSPVPSDSIVCTGRKFAVPIKLGGPVNSLYSDDWGPSLSPDEKTIYFKSWRGGGLGSADIWMATLTAQGEFSPPKNLKAPINSKCEDSGPEISSDGLQLFFSSKRYAATEGCQANSNIWIAKRVTTSVEFSTAALVTEINSTSSDNNPALSSDGLTIYFNSWRSPSQGSAIWVATRSLSGGKFSAPKRVANLDSAFQERSPAVSADHLKLYFSSNGPGSKGGLDIWVATRPSTVVDFSSPAPVSGIQTIEDETGSYITRDGKALYFNYRTNTSGTGTGLEAHIWKSSLICAP